MLKRALEATFSYYLENFIYTNLNGPRKKNKIPTIQNRISTLCDNTGRTQEPKGNKTVQIYEALEIICKLSLN